MVAFGEIPFRTTLRAIFTIVLYLAIPPLSRTPNYPGNGADGYLLFFMDYLLENRTAL